MFDVGWSELLVIGVVLIVVVGPKDLPGMLRQFGRTTKKLRAMAGDFRKQFDEALEEADLGDVKDIAGSMRKFDPRSEIRKHLSPLEKVGEDVKRGLDDAMKPKTDTSAEPASSVAHEAEPLKSAATTMPESKQAPTRKTARKKTTSTAKKNAARASTSGSRDGAANSPKAGTATKSKAAASGEAAKASGAKPNGAKAAGAERGSVRRAAGAPAAAKSRTSSGTGGKASGTGSRKSRAANGKTAATKKKTGGTTT